ncbi:MAG: 7TM domain-containing protein, partial [Spirochaetaceae bacterium]|nr:7TM domain-containing protein [Spirochaetaceae bacterium]
KGGFSLSILQFLLVIPFAVLFVVFFKNVIGLRTYGTFLPALMAMAVQETGLQAGLLAFVLVLFITVLARYPLEKLGLLHTPKLAIMMVAVIFSLLAISILSLNQEWSGFSALTSAAVFPIAILTITSERIALTISEEGIMTSISVLFQTLLVVSVCFLLISSVALQALILIFPEILLGVLAMNLWIGSWTGIRVLEFYRFRLLLFPKDPV